MPLRAIASYYPNAVRQALVEQAYHGRIIALAQTWTVTGFRVFCPAP
jgi:hypothetical protein